MTDPDLKPVRTVMWSLRFGVVSLLAFVVGALLPAEFIGDLLCGAILLLWAVSTSAAVSLASFAYVNAQGTPHRGAVRKVAIASLAFVVAQPALLLLVFVGLSLAGVGQ